MPIKDRIVRERVLLQACEENDKTIKKLKESIVELENKLTE